MKNSYYFQDNENTYYRDLKDIKKIYTSMYYALDIYKEYFPKTIISINELLLYIKARYYFNSTHIKVISNTDKILNKYINPDQRKLHQFSINMCELHISILLYYLTQEMNEFLERKGRITNNKVQTSNNHPLHTQTHSYVLIDCPDNEHYIIFMKTLRDRLLDLQRFFHSFEWDFLTFEDIHRLYESWWVLQ